MLIDRGGAGGAQTFAEAAATAAGAVVSVPLLSPHQGILGGVNGGVDGGGDGGRCCRCVGVIIANDRPGHEVFPMAAPASANNTKKGVRAPYPVVMVSQESGQLLKGSLAPTSSPSPAANSPAVARAVPQFGSTGGAPLGVDHAGWSGGSGGGGVIVSLGAARHCAAPAVPAAETSPCSYTSSSPATSASSADSYGEEDGDFEGSRFTTVLSAGDGYGWAPPVAGGYSFPHASSGYEIGNVGPPPFCFWYNSQSNAVALAEELRSNSAEVGAGSRGNGCGAAAAAAETGEWTKEEMLYRAKTLPVRFNKSIW